jgi:hypothetical protein
LPHCFHGPGAEKGKTLDVADAIPMVGQFIRTHNGAIDCEFQKPILGGSSATHGNGVRLELAASLHWKGAGNRPLREK